MEQYISKSAVVAEIEKRKNIHFNDYFVRKSGNPADYGASNTLTQLLDYVSNLEVKEVNEEPIK